jgi:hypothetical protein
MRKGISILFALIMILSVARITIATHYCGGKVADTKVSLSGKLASCGMESTEKSIPLSGNNLTKHCCEDQVIRIGTCNIFTSPVSFITENIQNLQHFIFPTVFQSFHSIITTNSFYTSISPPGHFIATAVSLDDICVFRI